MCPIGPQEQLRLWLRKWLHVEDLRSLRRSSCRGSGSGSMCRGIHGPQDHNSIGAGPRAQGTGLCSPKSGTLSPPPRDEWKPGGPRTARTLLSPNSLKLCRLEPPSPEHPGSCGLGGVVTARADSRAEELATATVVPPGVTLYLGKSRGLRGYTAPIDG